MKKLLTDKEFATLRKNGQYSEFGHIFFRAFVTMSGEDRESMSNKWNKLSDKEKLRCEGK